MINIVFKSEAMFTEDSFHDISRERQRNKHVERLWYGSRAYRPTAALLQKFPTKNFRIIDIRLGLEIRLGLGTRTLSRRMVMISF